AKKPETTASRKQEIQNEIEKLTPEIEKVNAQFKADERLYKKVWKPLERVRRVQAGERVVHEFARLSEEYVPKMIGNGDAQQKYMSFWAEKSIERMQTLRENRVGAQLAMKYFVYGIAVASFITPDFVGMAEGYSEWSRPVTFLIEASVLLVLGKMKGMTAGTKIIRELGELQAMMRGWALYVKIDRETGLVAGLKRKLNDLSATAIRSTNLILAPTRFRVGAQCPGLFI
ncbi:MAG: hypothetical protein AAB250_07055, partial [Bdellovibrionota bacterium]